MTDAQTIDDPINATKDVPVLSATKISPEARYADAGISEGLLMAESRLWQCNPSTNEIEVLLTRYFICFPTIATRLHTG